MTMGLKIFCFFMLGIFACSKVNQWKKPTKVCFTADLMGATVLEGALTLKKGHLVVSSFEFDGKRTEGADVYFVKDYTGEFKVPFGEEPLRDLSFDVPQGIYTEIDVKVVSKNEQLPNLVVDGVFEGAKIGSRAIRFELNQSKTFLIAGEDLVSNNKEVDLMETTKAKAIILLDPSPWFVALEEHNLEQAKTVSIDGKKTILINKTTNSKLYDKVVAALGKDKQKAIFVKQS